MNQAVQSTDNPFLLSLGQTGGGEIPMLLVEVVLFFLCLMFSAFFSGAETALTSMTKFRVKRLFGEGEETYKRLEPWLFEPNRFLVTILIGNTFVNILASVTAANFFERLLLHFNVNNTVAYGSAIAVAVTTFVLLVFGEIIPKTYCKEYAVRLSQKVIGPLDVIYRIMRPFIGFFLFIANTFIRLFGGQTINEVPFLTAEDVRALIAMSEREGVLEEEEREMIHSIIDFGDRSVKEIMTPRVDLEAIESDLDFETVRRLVIEKGHSRIPVYEDDLDKIVGILYAKDLLRVDNHDQTFKLSKILRPPLFIPKTKKINDLLKTFQKEKTHIAIVVDEYGLTAGLVSIEDVLEEIVGDIQDEFDEEEREYEIQSDGSILADAKIHLDVLSEVVHVEFQQEDVETLGGLVTALMGDVPEIGEEVDYETLHFTILDSDERKVMKVKIETKKAEIPQEEKAKAESHPIVNDSKIISPK